MKTTNPNPPWALLLTSKAVEKVTRGALAKAGWPRSELEDGVQEVRLKIVVAAKRGARLPEDEATMAAYCATTARRVAIDRHRGTATEEDALDGSRPEPERASADTQLRLHAARVVGRDPVDAGRQLEVAAQLFREGKMPAKGVAILEGIASGCSGPEVAHEEGITAFALQGRLKSMRRSFRQRLEEEGLLEARPKA